MLRNISHTGHLIGTILTVGVWAPFWLLASINTARLNRKRQEQYARAMAEYDQQLDEWRRWRDREEKR